MKIHPINYDAYNTPWDRIQRSNLVEKLKSMIITKFAIWKQQSKIVTLVNIQQSSARRCVSKHEIVRSPWRSEILLSTRNCGFRYAFSSAAKVWKSNQSWRVHQRIAIKLVIVDRYNQSRAQALLLSHLQITFFCRHSRRIKFR